MKYNIVAIGDVHWGAIDPDKQLQEFELFLQFIEAIINEIDLVVINGDYFDYKLPLNSRSAIHAINCMHRLVELSYGIDYEEYFKIRIVRGTKSHDEDQLEVFRNLESGMSTPLELPHFRIIDTLTMEETLEGLNILYGPDENIPSDEYYVKYIDTLVNPKRINMGFFHGNFDILTNAAAVESIKNNNLPTVIFDYNLLKNIINGPIITSHQHKHAIIHPLYNIGSYSRWEFDQEEPKGFGFITYDTETCNFEYKQIENIFTPEYDTYEFRTSDFKSTKEMTELVNVVKKKVSENPTSHIRVKIIVDDESPEKAMFVSGIKDHFLNTRRVKVYVTNVKKQKQIEYEVKETQDRINKFEYITSPKYTETQKIKKYLLDEKHVDIPDEILEKYIGKYLNKK